MYRIVFLWLNSLFIISCNMNKVKKIELPYYNNADFTPIFIKNKLELKQKITHSISDFLFLNEDSMFISQKKIENKIHVAK
jgi:protein SCO1